MRLGLSENGVLNKYEGRVRENFIQRISGQVSVAIAQILASVTWRSWITAVIDKRVS